MNLIEALGLAETESEMQSNILGQQIPNYVVLEEGEDWRYINKYPRYIITTHGRVLNIFTGRELKQSKHVTCRNKDSIYCIYEVNLMPLHGKPKCYRVHRLVAETFIPVPTTNPDGTKIVGALCVNHKDGNTANNNVDNLEWCDLSYNSRQTKRPYTRTNKYGVLKEMSIEELKAERAKYPSRTSEYNTLSVVISKRMRGVK